MIATNPNPDTCPIEDCPVPRTCSLAQLGRGECAVICQMNLDEPDRELLDSMGLCNNARVRVCRGGEPCIVVAEGAGASACRFGLPKALADKVIVTPHTPKSD